MGCSPNCGSDREYIELLIGKALSDAIKSGDLQAGLSDCEGGSLSKGAKVVLCDTLADKINDLIKDGTIDVVSNVEIKDGKLIVTGGDGKETETTIDAVKDITIADGKIKYTKADGTKETVDTPFVSDLSFDGETNKLSWKENNQPKDATLPYIKAAVGDKEVVLTSPNGDSVAVPKADAALSEEDFDHTITKDANVPGKFGVKVGDGLEAALDGVKIKVGDGLKVDAQGNLVVDKDVAPERMTSINNGPYKLGFHTFSGSAENTTGLPLDIASEEKEQGMSPTPVGNYDYNGYYIASAGQVDVWLQGVNNTAWYIMNDGGVNPDGTLVNPNGWGQWQKLDNASSVTNELIKAMQDQITNLARTKVDKSVLVRLVDASGTVASGYVATTNA